PRLLRAAGRGQPVLPDGDVPRAGPDVVERGAAAAAAAAAVGDLDPVFRHGRRAADPRHEPLPRPHAPAARPRSRAGAPPGLARPPGRPPLAGPDYVRRRLHGAARGGQAGGPYAARLLVRQPRRDGLGPGGGGEGGRGPPRTRRLRRLLM